MKSKKRTPLSFAKKIDDLDGLSPKRLAKYEYSLEVLQLMRQNKMTLTSASKKVQISPSTVKRNVGSALQKKNNRVTAKKNDNLLRKLRIYQNGKEVWIQVRGNKNAAKIARYHGAVGKLKQNQPSTVQNLKKKTIRDVNGKTYKFETDSKKIKSIEERREESEFFSIYGGK